MLLKNKILSNLSWLCFVFAGGGRLRNEADVDGAEVLSAHPKLELPETYKLISTEVDGLAMESELIAHFYLFPTRQSCLLGG